MAEATIILRAQDERTAGLARAVAEQRAGAGCVRAVREQPFIKAVLATFAAGCAAATPYLVALDADVLLYAGALDYMIEQARRHMTDSVFRIDFFLDDKFRGRTTGVHFYNNAHSRGFLDHVASLRDAGQVLRAESDNVVSFCRARGLDYAGVQPAESVACHDFFQFFAHLQEKYRRRYARCLVDRNLAPLLSGLRAKRDAGRADPDERLVLAVLERCQAGDGEGPDLAAALGLAEKSPLTPAACAAIPTALPRVGQGSLDALRDAEEWPAGREAKCA